MAIMCRHSACDGRSRNDRRSDRPPLSLIEHSRALCALHQQFGQSWHAKRHAEHRKAYRTKYTDIDFLPTMARRI